MRFVLILALLLISFPTLPSVQAAETQYFEKTLSEAGKNVGKTLDHVKVKTQEIAKQTQQDLEEVKKDDWQNRIKAAAKEFSQGVGRAWNELRGQHD